MSRLINDFQCLTVAIVAKSSDNKSEVISSPGIVLIVAIRKYIPTTQVSASASISLQIHVHVAMDTPVLPEAHWQAFNQLLFDLQRAYMFRQIFE